MRTALHALTDELRRLKTAGVKTIAVSDETVAALRQAIAARSARAGVLPAVPATTSSTLKRPEPSAAKTNVSDSVARKAASTEAPRSAPDTARRVESGVRKPSMAPAAAALPTAPNVMLPGGDKASRWRALVEQVANDAVCKAHLGKDKKLVLGVGSHEAKIMFVGDAPGPEEEVAGEPFVGPSGQLLTRMIQAMGLQRADVFLASLVTWRPPVALIDGREQAENRPPNDDELRYCLPFLRAQAEIVNPDLLVALGAKAAQGLLGTGSFKVLGDVRGKWQDFLGKPLMVTYHPSYILRNPTNRSKRMIWEDLLKVMERATLPVSEKQRGYFLEK